MKSACFRVWPTLLALTAACSVPGVAHPAEPSAHPRVPEMAAAPSGASILIAAPGPESGSFHVWAVDAATGAASGQTLDVEIPGAEMSTYALSPDRQTLAVATGHLTLCEPFAGGVACMTGTDTISLLNMTTGEARAVDLDRRERISHMAFDSSGRRLAMLAQSEDGPRLLILEADAARIDGDVALPIVGSILGFSADGASLVVFGADPGSEPGLAPPEPAQVLLFDAADLSTEWSHTIDGLLMGSWCLEPCGSNEEPTHMMSWSPAFSWQGASDRLLILHAESGRLTTVDVRNRLVESVQIGPAKTWLDRLMAWGTVPAEAKGWAEGAMKEIAVSPDSSTLYSVGRLLHTRTNPDGSIEGWEEPIGLDIVDPATGQLRGHSATDAAGLRLSGDGRLLVLETWGNRGPSSQVLDAQSLKTLGAFEGWQILTVTSRAGRSLLLATSQGPSTTRFALIDPVTMQRNRAWTVDGIATVITP